jgi:hypothetical protein
MLGGTNRSASASGESGIGASLGDTEIDGAADGSLGADEAPGLAGAQAESTSKKHSRIDLVTGGLEWPKVRAGVP